MVEVIERHIELSYNICIRETFVRYAVASCMIRSKSAKERGYVIKKQIEEPSRRWYNKFLACIQDIQIISDPTFRPKFIAYK